MYRDSLIFEYSNSMEEEQMDLGLKREINLARNIQTSLLNGKTPTFEGGEVSGTSLPARLIGGDYYDFYPLLNGKIRIVIGDVMGKGIPAAMLMILTRGAFRSTAQTSAGPGDTLTSMNKAIYHDLRTLRSFVTLFCADWDPKTNTLTYANAGHTLPLYIKNQDKSVKELPKLKGIMVGGIANQEYKEESIQLEDGDTIFFYTDGIIEAINKDGEQYKIERLSETLAIHQHNNLSNLEKCVMDSIKLFVGDVPQKDDITMVILKVSEKKVDITSLNSPVIS